MRSLLVGASTALLLVLMPVQSAGAKDPPAFMKETYPQQGLKSAWEEQEAILDPKGALDAKTKHLIGLGVAAQIPCDYCVYFHTQAAKHDGATDAQIKEAIAAAALTRKWSTVLNGSSYDMQKFRKQVDASFASQ